MYSEEETELRDLIMQNLENCGFLSKIKAEIRAGVFLALEEDGNFKNKVPLFNKKFEDFVSTAQGKIVVSLIREFLDYYSLHFTLSIFEPEVASPTPFASRSELCDQLNIKSSENDEPILVALLKDVVQLKEAQSTVSSELSTVEFNSSHKPVKTTININNSMLEHSNPENVNYLNQNSTKIDSMINDSDEVLKSSFNAPSELLIDNANSLIVSDILKETNDSIEKNDKNSTSKKSPDLLAVEHDPFFDEPLPPEKTILFKLTQSSINKPDKIASTSKNKDFDDSNKSSLASLRDLPSLATNHDLSSLTTNHEWTFSRDAKNTLPSLDSLKSVSSSETSNEEIINLDTKENPDKKNCNVVESNEDSSEKQNSEESIEEEIEEDFSAGYDDLLNSSLSLADDVTTDQTVSQVSLVEGVDHVEPCK